MDVLESVDKIEREADYTRKIGYKKLVVRFHASG